MSYTPKQSVSVDALQPMALDLVMPWTPNTEQEEKFQRTLRRVLIPLLLLLLAIPWLPVFDLSYVEPEKEVVKTKVILKPKVIPPPPPPPPPVVEVKPKPKPKPVAKPKPKPKQKVAKAKPKTKPKPVVDAKTSLKNSQGLNKLSSQLSSLRGALDLSRMQSKNVTSGSKGQVKQNRRQMLGQDTATRKSGGINVDDRKMAGDAAALVAHNSTNVDGLAYSDLPQDARGSAYGTDHQGMRDMESIRRTLEGTKSRVYSIYQQALKQNPNLSGNFTFKLVIQPDGSISHLRLVASELGVADLEKRILDQIRRVRFGAKDVSPTPIQYKFSFLPS